MKSANERRNHDELIRGLLDSVANNTQYREKSVTMSQMLMNVVNSLLVCSLLLAGLFYIINSATKDIVLEMKTMNSVVRDEVLRNDIQDKRLDNHDRLLDVRFVK